VERRTGATNVERATGDDRNTTGGERRRSSAYDAARERVAFRRRHERGVLRAAGKDRLEWLQGLLTNDVKSFGGPGWAYAAWLTPQGLELLRAAQHTHFAGVERLFFDRLSPSDVETLARVFEPFRR